MSDDNEGQDHAGGGVSGVMHKIPAWGWAAIIAGSLGIAYIARTRSSSATATPATDTSGSTTGTDTSTGIGTDGVATYDPSADLGGGGGGTDYSTSGNAPIQTNSDWQNRAVQILVGRLYDPVTASRAIADYLAGNALTTVERAIVNEALIALGPPPQQPPPPDTADQPPTTVTPPPVAKPPVGTPTPPITGKPVPPPHKPIPQPVKPGSPKTVTKTYTVHQGDTLGEIASHLGVSLATLKLYNPVYWVNPKYHNGNTIFAGDTVRYPAKG